MSILGIRCSNSGFTFVVLGGGKRSPKLEVIETLHLPKGFKQSESLDWVYKESTGIIEKHSVDMIVIKKFEGRKRDQTYADRVSLEAAVTLAAAHSGQIPVFKKVKSTIAKDLGFKGRARYLKKNLDTTVVDGFDHMDEKSKDAILSADNLSER